MTKAGCKVTFSENDVVLHSANGFMSTLIQPKKEGLYLLGQTHPCIYPPHSNKLAYHATIRPSNDCSNLWHHRLGHANMRKLSTMQQLNVVHGFPKFTLRTIDFCESCHHGKQTRPRFPKVALKAQVLLELVHSDICGPMPGYSIRGACYFITFIDDYSRYSMVYLLQRKSEAIINFKEYHLFVEKQTSLHI
jgi:hypothetical protein